MRLHIIAPTYDRRVVAGAGLALVRISSFLLARYPESRIYLNRETAKMYPDWAANIVEVESGGMERRWTKSAATARLQAFGFSGFPRSGVCWFPFGPMMPYSFSGRAVSTIYDTLELDRPGAVPWVERLYRAIMLPRTARRTHVVTISNFSRKQIQRHYGIDSEVIPLGVDLPGESSASKVPDMPYAFYPANAYAHKNHKFLLQLWQRDSRLHRIALVLTLGSGNGDLDPAIDRARAAGARVLITGRASDAEITGLYRNALCSLFPTLYEGYGLPMREALLNECPVVANADCEALRETVKRDYPLFAPLDFERWAEMILSIESYHRSHLADFAVVSSWGECANRYAEVFEAIASVPSKPFAEIAR